jgi:hypothetical protein
MAIWVNLNRAAKFPEVINVYARAGRGQGSTQGAGGSTPKQAAKGFLMTVKIAVNESAGAALPAWIRKAPGAAGDWQNVQVDVTAIPGVRKLNVNGKWQKFGQ